jgi:processing peptidase subunit beta
VRLCYESNRVLNPVLVFARVLHGTDVFTLTMFQVINDEDHALAAIGPIFELPDYNWIRRRSYWHRY